MPAHTQAPCRPSPAHRRSASPARPPSSPAQPQQTLLNIMHFTVQSLEVLLYNVRVSRTILARQSIAAEGAGCRSYPFPWITHSVQAIFGISALRIHRRTQQNKLPGDCNTKGDTSEECAQTEVGSHLEQGLHHASRQYSQTPTNLTSTGHSQVSLLHTEVDSHLEQGLHHTSVLRSEAHVQSGRQLQRVEVPAASGQRIVDSVDVERARFGGLERYYCHGRLPCKLQPLYGLHSLCKLPGRLCTDNRKPHSMIDYGWRCS